MRTRALTLSGLLLLVLLLPGCRRSPERRVIRHFPERYDRHPPISPGGEERARALDALFERRLAAWRRGERKGVVADLTDLYLLAGRDRRIGTALTHCVVGSRDRAGATRLARLLTSALPERVAPDLQVRAQFVRALRRERALGRADLLPAPEEARLLTEEGEEAFFRLRFEQAEELFALALRRQPKDAQALSGLEASRERIRTFRRFSRRMKPLPPILDVKIAPEPPARVGSVQTLID